MYKIKDKSKVLKECQRICYCLGIGLLTRFLTTAPTHEIIPCEWRISGLNAIFPPPYLLQGKSRIHSSHATRIQVSRESAVNRTFFNCPLPRTERRGYSFQLYTFPPSLFEGVRKTVSTQRIYKALWLLGLWNYQMARMTLTAITSCKCLASMQKIIQPMFHSRITL